MGHKLVHLLPLCSRLLIADLKCLVDGFWIVQRLQTDVCHIRIADGLRDAIALQMRIHPIMAENFIDRGCPALALSL